MVTPYALRVAVSTTSFRLRRVVVGLLALAVSPHMTYLNLLPTPHNPRSQVWSALNLNKSVYLLKIDHKGEICRISIRSMTCSALKTTIYKDVSGRKR